MDFLSLSLSFLSLVVVVVDDEVIVLNPFSVQLYVEITSLCYFFSTHASETTTIRLVEDVVSA